MKYLTLLLLFIGSFWTGVLASPIFDYAEHSQLQSGNWVKISVAQSGVHKLTYQQLQNMGLQQVENIKVYGYGGAMLPEVFSASSSFIDDLPQVPIYIETGADGIFNENDYILFYAQGPIQVNYNNTLKKYQHTQNPYSTLGYYFLTTQGEAAKRISLKPQESGNDTLKIRQSYNYFYHEKEMVNLLESGRQWYGEEFNKSTKSKRFSFSIPNLASNELDVDVAYVGCEPGYNHLQVSIGENSETFSIYNTGNTRIAGVWDDFYRTFTYQGTEKITVQCTCQPTGNNKAYLDYLAISAYQQLTTEKQSEVPVFFPSGHDNNRIAQYGIYNSSSSVQIWEITQVNHPEQIPTLQKGDSLYFVAKHDAQRRFIAVNTQGTFPTPTFVSAVDNQDLHSYQNVDLVIISPQEYLQEAERLARHHRDHDGMVVKTVTPQAIYNEFSSGTPDATAYRRFVKMLYDKADSSGQKPRNLLFIGCAYYDNRGIKHPVPELLSYQSKESLYSLNSYTSDDYFTLLDNNEGKAIEKESIDIGVGRLPVSNLNEAKICVDKIIRYATQSANSDWRNQFTFLADDEDSNTHMLQANALADTLMRINSSYIPHKIWLDAYPLQQNATGATYPKAKEEVLRQIQEGTLVFTYVGHGSPYTLSSEQTITKADIAYMNNSNLGLWITATCDFSRYDNYERSAGMEVVLNPNGGGIASFTTTRVAFSSSNNKLAQAVYHELIPQANAEKPTLGDVVRNSKNKLLGDTNKLNFCLLGDPALTLQYPQQKIVTDSINGMIPAQANLPALGLITIKASVRDEQNLVDTDFQGTAHITLYDKAENLQTLSGKGNNPFTYTDYQNKLFSGKVDIIDGQLEFTFMVPKDINYSTGPGRIIYYASHEDGIRNAHGYNHDFSIGGNSGDIETSPEGPIMRLYINTPQFVSGQKVNDSPVFYAHLYDPYGINTVGAGIGHDITLRMSSNPKEVINLNAFYESSLNDYKNGMIRYPLGNLPEGEYTLELKSWNLQNVSSTASIHFVVEKGLKPTIEEFSIFPNPVKEEATLTVAYDRPGDNTQIEFFIYDLVGQCHWQSGQAVKTTDGKYTATWHVNTQNGIYLKPGLYLATVRVTTSEGTFMQNTKKIMVVSQ